MTDAGKRLIAAARGETIRQDGLALLRDAVTEYYGERCEDYEPGCACCDAWAALDRMESDADRLAAIHIETLEMIEGIVSLSRIYLGPSAHADAALASLRAMIEALK